MLRGLEHVMMIIPIDAHINEAQDITQKHRQFFLQGGEFSRVRHFQFQYHDGDDDGEYTVAEGFKSVFFHVSSLVKGSTVAQSRLNGTSLVAPERKRSLLELGATRYSWPNSF